MAQGCVPRADSLPSRDPDASAEQPPGAGTPDAGLPVPFRVRTAQSVLMRSGETKALEVQLERDPAFDGEVQLGLRGLPKGVQSRDLTLTTFDDHSELMVTVAPTVKPGTYIQATVEASYGERVATATVLLIVSGESFQVDPHFCSGGSPEGPLLPLSEGGFLLAGPKEPYTDDRRLAIARFFDDGTLDTSFGDEGFAVFAALGDVERVWDFQRTPDGHLLVVSQPPGCDAHWCALFVSRHLATGEPDPAFGDGGRVSLTWLEHSPGAVRAAVELDESFAVLAADADGTYAMQRWNRTGVPLTEFGEAGITRGSIEVPAPRDPSEQTLLLLDHPGRGPFLLASRLEQVGNGDIVSKGIASGTIHSTTGQASWRAISTPDAGALSAVVASQGEVLAGCSRLLDPVRFGYFAVGVAADSVYWQGDLPAFSKCAGAYLDDQQRALIVGTTADDRSVIARITEGALDPEFGENGTLTLDPALGVIGGIVAAANGSLFASASGMNCGFVRLWP